MWTGISHDITKRPAKPRATERGTAAFPTKMGQEKRQKNGNLSIAPPPPEAGGRGVPNKSPKKSRWLEKLDHNLSGHLPP